MLRLNNRIESERQNRYYTTTTTIKKLRIDLRIISITAIWDLIFQRATISNIKSDPILSLYRNRFYIFLPLNHKLIDRSIDQLEFILIQFCNLQILFRYLNPFNQDRIIKRRENDFQFQLSNILIVILFSLLQIRFYWTKNKIRWDEMHQETINKGHKGITRGYQKSMKRCKEKIIFNFEILLWFFFKSNLVSSMIVIDRTIHLLNFFHLRFRFFRKLSGKSQNFFFHNDSEGNQRLFSLTFFSPICILIQTIRSYII